MTQTHPWHEQEIQELETLLRSNEDVIALGLFGSASQSADRLDRWSDLDCLVVVQDSAYSHFYPSTRWLDPLGTLFASDHSEADFHGTLRTCFTDFRRFDFLVTTPYKLSRLSEWPSVPFWRGTQLLFSHSEQVTHDLDRTWPPPKPTFPSPDQFDEMVDHFWFKAMLAGYKVLREDRLIALHLTLDLVRDCCVLGMMLRDRKEGTNIHRDGGMGNLFVDASETTCSDYSATSLLNMIEQSSLQFEQLAKEWSANYQERRDLLLPWLENIRRAVESGRQDFTNKGTDIG